MQECLSQKLYDENLPFFFEDLYINETGTKWEQDMHFLI